MDRLPKLVPQESKSVPPICEESLEQRQNNYMHYIAKEHPEIAEEARKTGDYLVLFGEKIIFRAKTEAQCWHFLSTTRLAGIIVTPY